MAPAQHIYTAAVQNRTADGASRPQHLRQPRKSAAVWLAPAAVAAALMLHTPAMHAADLGAGSGGTGPTTEASKFEPQFNPGLLAVALFAAVSDYLMFRALRGMLAW